MEQRRSGIVVNESLRLMQDPCRSAKRVYEAPVAMVSKPSVLGILAKFSSGIALELPGCLCKTCQISSVTTRAERQISPPCSPLMSANDMSLKEIMTRWSCQCCGMIRSDLACNGRTQEGHLCDGVFACLYIRISAAPSLSPGSDLIRRESESASHSHQMFHFNPHNSHNFLILLLHP